jgi:hypothetical protein
VPCTADMQQSSSSSSSSSSEVLVDNIMPMHYSWCNRKKHSYNLCCFWCF